MRKKLLKAFIRLLVLFVVFVVSALITSGVVNQGNTDMTAQMKKLYIKRHILKEANLFFGSC